MSEGSGPVDFRARFLKLFGYTVILATIGVVVWAVVEIGAELGGKAVELRCRDNLRSIVTAMELYRSRFGMDPPYLTALLPVLDGAASKLQCPADPHHGQRGCQPEWLRPAFGNRLAHTDLDGPTMDPARDRDSIPCSYLYVANDYPCGFTDFEQTWRQHFEGLRKQFGDGVPMIRCYYHLPKQYIAAPDNPKALYPDPNAEPTFNITADGKVKSYRLDWQSEPEFQGK
jgi:hypothetical protein